MRIPAGERLSDQWLRHLSSNSILPTHIYDRQKFTDARTTVRRAYSTTQKSSIAPIEERLLYAASEIIKPIVAVSIGSYRGYATAWIIPNLAPGGRAYLIDPDEDACSACRERYDQIGFAEHAEVIAKEFSGVLHELPPADLVWIDATGAKNNPPDCRGKKIYGPIIEAMYPKIKESGIVIAHNVRDILPSGRRSTTGYFKPYLKEHFRAVSYLPTHHGMAFAKK